MINIIYDIILIFRVNAVCFQRSKQLHVSCFLQKEDLCFFPSCAAITSGNTVILRERNKKSSAVVWMEEKIRQAEEFSPANMLW